MKSVSDLSPEELTQALAYAGFVLVAFELVKGMIVKPIKFFYSNTTFRGSGPFKSYEEDVESLHGNEFEACLLYLRNFMEVIDFADILSIQELRNHRNDLAHDLVKRIPSLQISDYRKVWEKVDRALFKLSNHKTIMEIGADPEFQSQGIDWEKVYGNEYALFDEVFRHVKLLDPRSFDE